MAIFSDLFSLSETSHRKFFEENGCEVDLLSAPRVEVPNTCFRIPSLDNGQWFSLGATVVNHGAEVLVILDDASSSQFSSALEAWNWYNDHAV